MTIRIAIDAMGGDYGPSVTVPAAIKSLEQIPELSLILVGDKTILNKRLARASYDQDRLSVFHASEVVGMDESPAQALRYKKDSSMRVSIDLVKNKKASACVSAGNTGALMATARFVLKTAPGIDRPAISTTVPTYQYDRDVRILDLGANVDSTAEQLFQFALMGSILAEAVDNVANPTVGLLNIGQEDIKGNELVKQTAQILQACQLINYAGNVEADMIFDPIVDVVVCDGFVGNIALKSSEGTAKLIASFLEEAFRRNLLTRLAGLVAYPVLKHLKKRIDPAKYNGASLVGLNGVVVKSHGHAKQRAYVNAINHAVTQVQKNIPQRLAEKVQSLLEEK